MKISRILATGAVVALIGGSSAFAGASATAAPVPVINFVHADDFGVEASPYAADWFKGTATPATVVTDGVSGISLTGQILNGDTPTTDLTGLVDGAGFVVASGQAAFQVSLFANAGNGGFTTLRPVDFNTLDGSWVTSRNLVGDDGTTVVFPAGSTATLDEFEESLGTDYTILAYGAFANESAPATITSITWDGVTSRFTPASFATPAANPISLSDIRAKGLTVRVTGFAEGESVRAVYSQGQGGDVFGDPFIADADGSVTVTFLLPDLTIGTWDFGAFTTAGIGSTVSVAVVADGATIAPPATPVVGNASFTG